MIKVRKEDEMFLCEYCRQEWGFLEFDKEVGVGECDVCGQVYQRYDCPNGEETSPQLSVDLTGSARIDENKSEQLSEVPPENTKPHRARKSKKDQLAATYLDAGVQLFRKELYQPAINLLTKAIELSPDCRPAYDFRGIAYEYVDEVENAIADFVMANTIDDSEGGTYCNLGLAYYRMSRYQEAVENYNTAIKLSPEIGVFYSNRGLAYSHLNELDKAITDYNKAIELKSEDTDVFSYRADALTRQGEYRKAIADFDKVLELDPLDINAYASRALTVQLMNAA
jgi:tetratricopeptide (TPR) repeat protein